MAKNKELTLEEKLREALIPKEELPYEIPENWEWAKLGAISTFIDYRGKTPIKVKEGIPLITAKNIKKGYINEEPREYIEIKNYEKWMTRGIPEKGDIAITTEAPLGNVAQLNFENKFALAQRIITLTDIKLNKKYLFFSLLTPYFQIQLKKYSTGSTVEGIKSKSLKLLNIPLPSLEEQKRIVEKLDSMFEKINRAKELIQEVKENIGNRKESILNKAFRGELTAEWRKNNQTEDAIELLKSINEEKLKNWEEACIEAEKNGKKKPSKPKIEDIQNIIISKEEEPYEIPKNWKWVKLGEVIDIKMGQSPNGETVNNTEGIGLIGGPNDMGNLYPKISRYTTSFTKLSSKDDIILSVRATLGRPIFSDGEYCLGRGVCGISSEIINKIFLRHYFFNITDYLYTIATGTTFVQISKENIINLNFPLPPLKEQEEVVRILDEILEKESKIKELIELEEAIELLEKSILDKAFRGELGTQNKDDEPAIELLKKIL